MLVEKLQEEYSLLEKALEERTREEERQQRIKFVSVSMDNIIKTPKKDGNDQKIPENGDVELNDIEFEKENRRDRRDRRRGRDSDESEETDEDEDDEASEEEEFLTLRSTRNKKINYKFTEFDDLINSAIRAEDEEVEEEEEAEEEEVYDENDGYSKGKDMATIENAAKEDELNNGFNLAPLESEKTSSDKQPEDETKVPVDSNVPKQAKANAKEEDDDKESDDDEDDKKAASEKESDDDFKPERPPIARGLKKGAKKRRLNDLDSPAEEEDSDATYKGSSDTEVEEASEETAASDSETEAESDDSDVRRYRRGSRSAGKSNKRSKGGKKSKKKGKYRREASDDSEDDYGKTRTRKAAVKRRSYKEVSSDDETEAEEEEFGYKVDKKKKRSGYDS